MKGKVIGKRIRGIDSDNLGISFMFDLPNPIIITHGDVDGLCAAALLVKEYKLNGSEARVFITQPFSLHSVLNDIRKNKLKGSLIIVDLALTDKSVKYRDGDEEKCRIPSGSIVIDHHPSSIAFKKFLEANNVYHQMVLNKSASQIVGKMVQQTKTNAYIIRLGGVGDWMIIDKKLGEQSMKISAAMSWNHRDDTFRLNIIKDLINGVPVHDMQEVAERAKLAFAKLDQTKKEGAELFRGKNFILVFYEEGFSRASALASKLAAATKKVALVLSLLSGNKSRYLLTARAPDKINGESIDLLAFLKEFKIGNDGGGLEKAASFTIRKNRLGELIEYLEIKDVNLRGVLKNDYEEKERKEAC